MHWQQIPTVRPGNALADRRIERLRSTRARMVVVPDLVLAPSFEEWIGEPDPMSSGWDEDLLANVVLVGHPGNVLDNPPKGAIAEV